MRKLFESLVFILLLSFSLGCEELLPYLPQVPGEDSTMTDSPDSTIGAWNLVWNDEFNGFDDNKWVIVDASSGINNDLAYLSPDNVTVQDGKLRIRADDNSIGDRNFTGGKVMSKGKFEFKHGRVAVRAKTASTPGTHTAAWLIHNFCDGVNDCVGGWPPEIDIVEIIGREPNKVHQTVHYGTTPYDGTTGGRWPDWGSNSTDITLAGDQPPAKPITNTPLSGNLLKSAGTLMVC